MLQQETPGDFVVATNTAYSVRDFLEYAFGHANLHWQDHVNYDERYLRPTEVSALISDYSRARDQLGWEPKVFVPELTGVMV